MGPVIFIGPNMKNLAFFLLILIPALAIGQTSYSLEGTEIIVKGTSSISDWEMKSAVATGSFEGKIVKNNLQKIDKLLLTVPAESLKSGRDGMDANAYKSLKTAQHQEIIFKSNKVKVTQGSVIAEGELTIAGTARPVQIKAECTVNPNGGLNCKGSEKLKMTDYNVEPPTAMFGSITTGDEIEIVFNASFSHQK